MIAISLALALGFTLAYLYAMAALRQSEPPPVPHGLDTAMKELDVTVSRLRERVSVLELESGLTGEDHA